MTEQQGLSIGIIYGEYRLAIAAHFGMDPADVTGEHVDMYESEKEQDQ